MSQFNILTKTCKFEFINARTNYSFNTKVSTDNHNK